MSNIADRIRKLIAKADSTSHPEEAETFMAKAQQLLEQHGMDLNDIGRLDEDDTVGRSAGDHLRNNGNANWRFALAGALAKFYGCRIIGTRRGNFTYWNVFGRESARVTFELMFPYVDRQVLALAREETRKGNFANYKQAHGQVGRALTSRIYRMMEAQEAARPAASADTHNALVPVDQIENSIEAWLGGTKLRQSRAGHGGATGAAHRAAAKVSLNRQATGSTVRRLTA